MTSDPPPSDWSADLAPGTPFGVGRSERAVEVPWALSWLAGAERILDIGFALSDLGWLRGLLALKGAGAELQAVDIIAPERVQSRYPEDLRPLALGVPSHIGDVRRIEVPGAPFDAVSCISTLEHIGFDAPGADAGSAFARWRTLEETPARRDGDVDQVVLERFRRLLRPGGRAVISVPMGKGGAVPVRDSLGFYTRQMEYDAESFSRLLAAPGFKVLERRFFRLETDSSWREVREAAALADQTAWLTPHAVGVGVLALERL